MRIIAGVLIFALTVVSLSGCSSVLEPLGQRIFLLLFVTEVNVPGFEFVAIESSDLAQQTEKDRFFKYTGVERENKISEYRESRSEIFFVARVYFSSKIQIETIGGKNLYYPMKFSFKDPKFCLTEAKPDYCLTSNAAYPADGLDGHAVLPVSAMKNKNPELYYYYTYISVYHEQKPPDEFGIYIEHKSYNLKTNPQTINARLIEVDGNFNRYTGNLFQIPKEKIAEALAATP